MKIKETEILTNEDGELLDNQDDFRSEFLALDKTPIEMAKQMKSWGDHRSLSTIVRSIQRMAAGDTNFSGEMRVIVSMMRYQQVLNQEKYETLNWKEQKDGIYTTMIDGFTLSLYPETKGRWSISIVHINSYSHPWPSWQTSLEAAKKTALSSMEDAKRHVYEYEK